MLSTLLYIDWDFNPNIFSIGSFEIRYYSLMWMAAFLAGIYVFTKMMRHESMDPKLVDSAFFYAFISTIVGARLGHCIFYEDAEFWSNPLQLFNLRQGGLASHGAAMGLLVGLWLFSRKHKLPYIWTLDRVVIVVPLGGAMIRMGNLFNSEVYGFATGSDYGFRFIENLPSWMAGAEPIYSLPSHPTQIYEAIIYVLIGILLIWLFFNTEIAKKYPGMIFGIFLITLFGSRFFVEELKQVQDAVDANFMARYKMNLGQALSLPFVAGGLGVVYMSVKGKFDKYRLSASMVAKHAKAVAAALAAKEGPKNKK